MAPKKATTGKKTLAASALNKEKAAAATESTADVDEPRKSSVLDVSLARKAVAALFTYEAKRLEGSAPVLIEDYAKPIIAQIQLIRPITKPVIRPVRVAIPYSMYFPDEQGHSVCFFCRTEDLEKLEGFLSARPFNGLQKVISITQLRKQYSAYKDKKKLLREHTHFVCDARVMTQLYNLLGKVFGDRNNFPVPIEFENVSKLPSALQKSLDSTYMYLKGNNISVRVGNSQMNPTDVAQNVLNGLEFAVQKMKGEWRNIQNIYLKTSTSPSLPIYVNAGAEVIDYIKKSKTAVEGVDSLSQGSTKTDKPKKKVNTTSSAKSATDAAVKSTTKGATDEGASIKSSKKLGAAPEKVSAAKKQKRS